MFNRSLAKKPSVPGLWFVESLLITISISVLEIDLFILLFFLGQPWEIVPF